MKLAISTTTAALLAILLAGTASRAVLASDASASPEPPRKIESKHLPNSYRLTDKVISGGQPDGEAAFAELRRLGIKTIVSVDGARPDVALARKYHLRYVHLPHGYDGIDEHRLVELAKAVRDLPGPIYVHCHHGKHRSPAAASAACLAAGTLARDQALAVLKTAGTSPNYRGLYATVARAKRLDPAVLDAVEVEFRETVDVPPLAEAMVDVEHIHDRLKSIAAAGWKSPPDHPDLDPAHEALMLREQFTELLRTETVKQQPAEFQALLRQGDQAAAELETALREQQGSQRAQTALARITNNCQACHTKFRDVPLGEKSRSVK